MTCMSMGYPDLQSEMEIAQGKTMTKAEDLQPVLLQEQLWEMQQYVEQIYVHADQEDVSDEEAEQYVQLLYDGKRPENVEVRPFLNLRKTSYNGPAKVIVKSGAFTP